jgi:hypothetical protein
MPTVQLRDIETEDDVEAVMGLRRGPGRDRYIGRMISHFEDAVRYGSVSADVVGPRRLDQRPCRLRDDQRRHPQDVLDADDDIVGPYFLWRLLIDVHHQGGATAGRRSTPSSTTSEPGRTPTPCT